MRTITGEEVDRAFQRVDTLPPELIESLVNEMSRKQPYLQTYLLAVGGDLLSDDEREVLNFLGTVVWRAFELSGGHVHQVNSEDLERAENASLAMLKYLEGEQITEFDAVAQAVVSKTNQPELIGFVVEALMEASEPGAEFREENAGLAFLYLKSVIDCLDQASH
jgi:hypothetical protein